MTLNMSLPALAATSQRPFGDSASAQACGPMTISLRRWRTTRALRADQSPITEPSLAMLRASTRTQRALPRRAGHAARVGPAAAPVADINLVAGQHHVERRDADVPRPQNFAGRRVQFEQAVGKIAARRKFFCRRRETAMPAGISFVRSGALAGGSAMENSGETLSVRLDAENLDVAVDVRRDKSASRPAKMPGR